MLLFKPLQVYSVYFEDNFENKDDSTWNYIEKSGSIVYHDGQVELSSNSGLFPELYSKKNIFSNIGDELEIVFKYNDNGLGVEYPPSGTGIGVGNTHVSAEHTFFQFAVWRDKANGPKLFINDFGLDKYGFCDYSTPYGEMEFLKILDLTLNRYDWNSLKIEYLKNNAYSIFVNGVLRFTTKENQCKPGLVTVGNPLQGANYWNGISIDKISYKKKYVVLNSKTIIIPGMGASWNEKAIVFNQKVEDSEWKMTPFVNNYEKLIKSYGKDVLVWNYDWRKPIKDIASDLGEFISKNIGPEDKFSIIGHSLGGVVGRYWLQNNIDDSRLEKVTTLGSPHRGSIDAYRIWAGGNISEDTDVASIALNVLLQLQKKNGENRVDTIRRFSPSLKDVSPTFDFIKKNGKVVKNILSVGSTGNDKLLTVSGTGFDTERWVKLGSRNRFEEALDWWPDGKILGYEYSDGDNAVLTSSSDFGNNKVLTGEHGDLPNVYLEDNQTNNLKNNWVFYIGSPAKLKIECAGKDDLVSEDFLVVKKENVDGCKLKIVATEDGVYHFVYGVNGVKKSWGYKESGIKIGEEVQMVIKSTDNSLIFEEKMVKSSLMELLSELKNNYKDSKGVDRAIKAAKLGNWKICLAEIFVFREKNPERKITNMVVNELGDLMMMGKGTKIGAEWWYQSNKIMAKVIDLFSKKVSIDVANSYALWLETKTDLDECYKAKNYSCVETKGLIDSYLFTEITFAK